MENQTVNFDELKPKAPKPEKTTFWTVAGTVIKNLKFLVIVKKNHAIVRENRITKNVKIQRKGLHLQMPLLYSSQDVKLSSVTQTYNIVEGNEATTFEKIDIVGPFNATFKVYPKKADKFVYEEYVANPVNTNIQAIARQIISQMNIDQVLARQTIKIDNNSLSMYPAIQGLVTELIEKYGIMLTQIDLSHLQPKNKDITNIEERNKIVTNENLIKVAQAENEKEVSRINNETRKAQAQTDAEIEKIKGKAIEESIRPLVDSLISKGFDQRMVLEYLKRLALKEGAIVIDGNSYDSQSLGTTIAMLQKNNQGLLQNDEATNEIPEAKYEETETDIRTK